MDPLLLSADLSEYVNGTLSSKDSRAMKTLIESDSNVKAEYDFLLALREGLLACAPPVPSDLSFEETFRRIEKEAASMHARDAGFGLSAYWDRFQAWFFRPSLSYGLAVALVVFQFGVGLAVFNGKTAEYSELRAQANAPAPIGPFVRVSLRPDTKEEDIRFLLIAVGATIVGGPTQLGDYFLYVAPDRTDWAAQQLRQSQIAENVTVIATLPPAKE